MADDAQRGVGHHLGRRQGGEVSTEAGFWALPSPPPSHTIRASLPPASPPPHTLNADSLLPLFFSCTTTVCGTPHATMPASIPPLSLNTSLPSGI